MSEQRNLGMTKQGNPDMQPVEALGLSKEEMHGLAADVDRGFKAFAKRIGLEPHEVGYMPARNPMGYKYYQKNPHLLSKADRETSKKYKASRKPTKQGFNYGNQSAT
jgi:hypothetical protein